VNIAIDLLADALAERIAPKIPFEVRLWGIEQIAAYLELSAKSVQERIVCLPGFPDAIRLPAAKGTTKPRWKACEVVSWVEQHQTK
jgi:hypothetical protein